MTLQIIIVIVYFLIMLVALLCTDKVINKARNNHEDKELRREIKRLYEEERKRNPRE